MALDVSGLGYFIPILSFFFVFIVLFAVLDKSKVLSESKFINIFVSFLVATVFITLTSARVYVENIIPWFAVLFVALVFVIILVGASQKDIGGFMKPWLGWVFIILLILVFLFAAFKVFSSTLSPLLPGSGESGTGTVHWIKDNIYTEKVGGAVLLIILTLLVSWVITRKAAK